ncbi:anti-sigma factor [Pararhodobacter zhoushanensis]|uniref:anti-sigma factor n=1 Tax=Pararhodobacter zhoushanensis TaxID=2479545 RepID=UPI000F8E9D91|nr:anti-sigma factor [Pararhodobacter zhoushanensis]
MSERPLDERIDELVVGLADEAETEALEALCARDPAVAARVERARLRYGALDDTADTLEIPATLWTRIAGALDAPVETAARVRENVVDLSTVRRQATRWRATALSGVAAALLLAVMLGWVLMATPQPSVIAVLLDAGGAPVALVEGSVDNTTRVTLLERAQVPDDRVMQVWTKPDDDGPPVSLGLLAEGNSRTLSLPGFPPPHANQLYEITYEPLGGSPTNLPTGPIHGVGQAQAPVY